MERTVEPGAGAAKEQETHPKDERQELFSELLSCAGYESKLNFTICKRYEGYGFGGCAAEQARLINKIIDPEDWAGVREEMDDSSDRFATLVKKYVDIPELTPATVNGFEMNCRSVL